MHTVNVPAFHLTDPAVQAAGAAALRNLLQINTIPCDFSVYNSTGLLDTSVPGMLRAGGSYQTPWTRDAAINTWAAGRLMTPAVSRNTLFAVCVPDAQGRPIIQPDDQRWDRVVWIVGAWQYYLATGDLDFLSIARGIAHRGLKQLDGEWFCSDTGLYRGGSFFNDGISGYPADIYEPGMDHSFMGMHPGTETIFCLSTNCLYCEAWRILDRMNALLDIRDPEPAQRHEALKKQIPLLFRDPETGRICYIRYPDGHLDPSRELAGISFGVLFGILSADELDSLEAEAWGIPSIMPPFPGLFSRERPGRHNNLIWPFLNGFFLQAASAAGMLDTVSPELRKITGLLNSADGIYEIYNPYDGSVDGGWQIGGDDLKGHHWLSCPDQTWSASCYLGGLIHGIFGVQIREEDILLCPCVPEYLKDSSVENLVIRGKTYTLRLRGWGSRVTGITFNGAEAGTLLPFADALQHNEITVTLA